jgi:hypothetical protein
LFDRAKELTSDAPSDTSTNTIPPAAADTSAAPSAATMKRSRDDEPAVAGGAVSRQKPGDGIGWDGVRVHRVGAAGSCVACVTFAVFGRACLCSAGPCSAWLRLPCSFATLLPKVLFV